MAETFVHDGQEVRKTGRQATQQIKTLNGKIRDNVLVEITPAGESDGWKKWVKHDELFIVSNG
jgi:hypothetical protein